MRVNHHILKPVWVHQTGFFIPILCTQTINPTKTKKMSTLKIAIQKSGRLNEDSIQILKDCGISINNGNDQLKAEASNFPLEVLYLRN